MYKEVVKGWVKHLDFMVLDILSLELSFLIAYIFRYKIRDGMIQSEIYRTLIIMIMLVDISACASEPAEIRARFDTLGQEMGMQVTVTRQEVFDAMHKV